MCQSELHRVVAEHPSFNIGRLIHAEENAFNVSRGSVESFGGESTQTTHVL